VLFGGEGPDWSRMWPILYNSVWEFDGNDWKEVSAPKPTSREEGIPRPRYGHSLVYDPKQKLVLLHGGRTTCEDPNNYNEYYNYRWIDLNDTWAWDGSAWKMISNVGRSRHGHSAVYDRRSRKPVLFGGILNKSVSVDSDEKVHYDDLRAYVNIPKGKGRFDLKITSFGVSKTVWESVDSPKVTIKIENAGKHASDETALWLYLGFDDNISDEDTLIRKEGVPSLDPGGSFTTTLNINAGNLMSRLPDGFFGNVEEVFMYLGVAVDRYEQLLDTDVENNTAFLDDFVELKKP
jgi:hypothetical protein